MQESIQRSMCVLYLAMYVATCIDWACMADHDNHDSKLMHPPS